jgi:glycosyltransferase involved in cell wall biosynthesis
MRIMFLYMFPFWGNGSASFLRNLSSELVKRGHDIAIVAPDKRTLPGIKHYVVKPPQMGVFVGHPELPKAKRFDEMRGKELGEIYTSYLKATINAVADFNPEIIHVFHTAFLPGIARVIKILFGIKYIITTHGSDLSYLVKDRRFMGLINDSNKVARFITANSDFTRKWYLKMFGPELRHKSTVIMGGVKLEDYKKDPAEIEVINKKYNLKDKRVVLFTGRLTKNKGVDFLVKAAPLIRGTIVIVGDGPERKNLEEEIKKNKIHNVVMVGYINPGDHRLFHSFYERADVFVSPSVWDEPLGLTILESMAAGTPVVATSRGGVLSLIQDKINGYLVRPRNSREIAGVVNVLLEDDKLRKKISAAAYKTIVEHFTWEKIANQFENIYKKFKYSTSEYMAIVRGMNPQLSELMLSLKKIPTNN